METPQNHQDFPGVNISIKGQGLFDYVGVCILKIKRKAH